MYLIGELWIVHIFHRMRKEAIQFLHIHENTWKIIVRNSQLYLNKVLVCSWPHSVGQNHFFVMMLHKDSTIQSTLRRLCTAKISVPCQPPG
jgi:hypothetical protein